MNLSPDVNAGKLFLTSRRGEASAIRRSKPTVSLHPNFAGEHFMKLGGGVSYITFDGKQHQQLRADLESGRDAKSTARICRQWSP